MHATRSGAAATAAPTAPENATPNAATGRAHWNKLKQATKTARTFRKGGKQRIKRLSKVMKARHNESIGEGGSSMEGEVQQTVLDVEAAVSIHVDEKSGRRYSCNAATGQTQWLSNDNGEDGTEDGTTIEEQGERKQESTKRQSFRKIVDDDNAVFFQNVETGETVWKVPETGDLMEF